MPPDRRNPVVRLLTLAVAAASAACASAPPPQPPVVTAVSDPPTGQVLPGKVVWRDLLTHRPEEAIEFYGGLFGWEFQPSASAGDRHWEIVHGGARVGSVFAVSAAEVEAPLWLVSVSVADLEDAVARASRLGASVTVPPAELPKRGRYSVIEDPQGAFLVLLRSSSGDPADGETPATGGWLWTELWTTDAPSAVDFYGSLLGYRSEGIASRTTGAEDGGYGEASPGEGLPLVFFALYDGERPRAGIHQLPGEARPHWLPYVAVEEVETVVKRARDLGGHVLMPPEAVRNAEAAILLDPTGAPFGIQQWPRPTGDAR